MSKETTYQKYKRERNQLKEIINLEIQSFCINPNSEEYRNRLNYLKQCLKSYRINIQEKK